MNAASTSVLHVTPSSTASLAAVGPLPWRLVLEPTAAEGTSPQPALTIPRLPVTLGRDTQALNSTQIDGTLYKRLSRRHARLFVKKATLYVEDLNSTNGTWINGKKLKTGASKRLRDGDTLVFGACDHFTYTVRLHSLPTPTTAAATALNATVPAAPAPAATVYISAGDDFLNLFCSEASPSPAARNERPTVPARSRPARKSRLFLAEFAQVFGDNRRTRLRRSGGLLLALGLLSAFAVGVYRNGIPERDVRALLAQARYPEALAAAERYLGERPTDVALATLAADALVLDTVPVWLKTLETGDFVTLDRQLASTGQHAALINDGHTLLELLTWIGEMEQFFRERGGMDAPIVLFKDELRIEALLAGWDRNSDFPPLLRRVLDQVPAFDALHTRTMSHLRQLRSEQALYLGAIADVKQTLTTQIMAGDSAALSATLDEFAGKYRKISGLADLRADTLLFTALSTAISRHNPFATRRVLQSTFRTPLFRRQVERWLPSQLPPRWVLDDYAAAQMAWEAGQSARALERLQLLTRQPWGETATQLHNHYRQTLDAYTAVQALRGQAGYGDKLLAFYATLQADTDRYFLDQLADDYRQSRTAALNTATAGFQQAQKSWSAYRSAGGIGGLLRLEQTLSDTFRKRAALLTQAYDHAQQAKQAYTLAQTALPTASAQLYTDILNEIKQQSRSLDELRLVVSAAHVDAKQALLPRLEETAP